MSVMALDNARSTFYVEATSVEFGLHSNNKIFVTQNEPWLHVRLNICHILITYFSVYNVQ